MGGTQSKYNLPSGRRYTISYAKQNEFHEKVLIKEKIHINASIENETPTDMLYSICYRLLENSGYSPSKRYSHYQPTSMNIEESIQKIKIKTLRGNQSDIVIHGTSYYPTLENIKKLLSQGNILVAGIVLEPECTVLDVVLKQRLTDVVCIIGYSGETLFIQTSWREDYLEVNCNIIKEIWNITIDIPEDKYMDNE